MLADLTITVGAFLTVISGIEHLAEIGRLTLWHGAQPILIERA